MYQHWSIGDVQPYDHRLTRQTSIMVGQLLTKRNEYLAREMQARARLHKLRLGYIGIDAYNLDKEALDMAQRAHGICMALELAYRAMFPDDYAPIGGKQVSDLAPLG